ncbi:MAG TPA: glycosyltransferase family 61 protein [Acetobacteraceae bacterium]|nr:glycosyltransferase family 61 protein [Acetobacteraceae bacterium]
MTDTAAPPIAQKAGELVHQLVSPAFEIPYPRIDNSELVPDSVVAACDRTWRRGRFPERPVTFRLLQDVFVVQEGLVFTRDLHLVSASRTQHSNEDIAQGLAAIREALARGAMTRLEGTCVLCRKRGETNYGHWLLEMFPKAVLAKENITFPDLRFIVPDAAGTLAAVIDDSLQWAGIAEAARVKLGRAPVLVSRLLLIDGLTEHGFHMSPLAVDVVRRFGRSIAPGPERVLYVSRGSIGHRTLRDEETILRPLQAAGVTPFDPGLADLATQAATFAGAGRVFGVLGAALTNIVFARPGTEVTLFTPANMPDLFFWFIAGLCGLHYREIRCPLAGPAHGPAPWDAPLILPAAAAIELLSAMRANPPPAAPDLPAPKPPRSPTRVYRQVSLAELAEADARRPDGRRRVERSPHLSAASLDLPAFRFGDTALTFPGLHDGQRAEGRPRREWRPGVDAFLIRDALVHGTLGLVSIDGDICRETLAHLPLHIMPDAAQEDAERLRLPERAMSAVVPAACHLLACNQDNYYHWLVDSLSRFSPERFAALGMAAEAPGGAVLLVPQLDVFWKWETLHALVGTDVPRVALADQGRILVQRLLLVPDISGGGFMPHPALLRAFDTIADNVMGAGARATAPPERRLYVARTDSRNRVLANERELIALVERAGFTAVELSDKPVPEQVRLFATASHILAPHGAGLTNIGFCRPGARIVELHPQGYVNWAFRRLAALRGLDYGCLFGETVERPTASPHDAVWRIDLQAVAAVLRDPRFLGV